MLIAHAVELPLPESIGTIHAMGRRLLVCCGNNTVLEIVALQQEGRKRISADAFLNGQRPVAGEKFGG